MQISAHDYLKLYWKRVKISDIGINFNYALKVYAFLKRWKHDWPQENLLNYPNVLSRAISVGFPVHSEYRFLANAMLNEELFPKFSSENFKNVIVSCQIDLKLFGPQIDRILDILRMSANEYLKLYWIKVGDQPVALNTCDAL